MKKKTSITARVDAITIVCIEIEMKTNSCNQTKAIENLILQGHLAKDCKIREAQITEEKEYV